MARVVALGLDGAIVSGILTPISAKGYVYPLRFAEILDEVTGGYKEVLR